MSSKLLLTGLLALCLTACAAPSSVIRETPPALLLADCPVPCSVLKTNADLARWALELREALGLCNLDKRALREWAEQ